MSIETLVELGPSIYPSKDHIFKVNPRNVVFVAPEPARFNYESMFPGSVYFDIGFLEYVTKKAELDSVDELLCVNVLNSPREGLNIALLLSGAMSVLKTGGVLRVENTTNLCSVKDADVYESACLRMGFVTSLHMAQSREQVRQTFVQPNLWHNSVDDGFSIVATKV